MVFGDGFAIIHDTVEIEIYVFLVCVEFSAEKLSVQFAGYFYVFVFIAFVGQFLNSGVESCVGVGFGQSPSVFDIGIERYFSEVWFTRDFSEVEIKECNMSAVFKGHFGVVGYGEIHI